LAPPGRSAERVGGRYVRLHTYRANYLI